MSYEAKRNFHRNFCSRCLSLVHEHFQAFWYTQEGWRPIPFVLLLTHKNINIQCTEWVLLCLKGTGHPLNEQHGSWTYGALLSLSVSRLSIRQFTEMWRSVNWMRRCSAPSQRRPNYDTSILLSRLFDFVTLIILPWASWAWLRISSNTEAHNKCRFSEKNARENTPIHSCGLKDHVVSPEDKLRGEKSDDDNATLSYCTFT